MRSIVAVVLAAVVLATSGVCAQVTDPAQCRIVDYGSDMGFGGNHYRGHVSHQFSRTIDVDGDGQFDDFSGGWEFSLTDPLNPAVESYTISAPSARFYGGLVAEYNWRNKPTEGHMNQNHGSRDDFNWMSLFNGAGTEPPANPVHGSAAFYFWKKDDFLNGGDAHTVRLDTGSRIALHISRYWLGFDYLRWVVRDGDQFFISEHKVVCGHGDPPGPEAAKTHTLSPATTNWGVYNPGEPYDIFFDESAASWSSHAFTNVTAVGFYIHRGVRESFAVAPDHLVAGGGAIQALKWYAFEAYATVDRSRDASPLVTMVDVPAGEVSGVDVGAFRMSQTEVTYTLWQKVHKWAVSNQYCRDLPWNGTYAFWQDGDMGSMDLLDTAYSGAHPVTDITWHDALAWCNAFSELEGLRPCYYADEGRSAVLRKVAERYDTASVDWEPGVYLDTAADGYRMPTQLEWLHACVNGGTGGGWGEANSGGRTHEAGGLAANSYGVHDLSGNVWEYVWGNTGNNWDPARDSTHLALGGGFASLTSAPSYSVMPYGSMPYEGCPQAGFRLVRGADYRGTNRIASAAAPSWTLRRGEHLNAAPGATPRAPSVQFVRVPGVGDNIPLCSQGTENQTTAEEVKIWNDSTIGDTAYDLYVGRTEVPFADWVRVREWGIAHGYRFDHDGDMGSMDWETALHAHTPDEPVTDVSWIDAIVWCNALSEMHGRAPLFHQHADFASPYRRTPAQRIEMWHEGGYHPVSGGTQPVFLDKNANGYRMPSMEEWKLFRDTYSNATEWLATNDQGTTQPVGGKQANAHGLYDVYGNVAEHCWDMIGPSVSIYGQWIAGAWFNSDGAGATTQWTTKKEDHTVGLHYVGLRLACDSAETSVSVRVRSSGQPLPVALPQYPAEAAPFAPATAAPVPQPSGGAVARTAGAPPVAESKSADSARRVVLASVQDTAPAGASEHAAQADSAQPALPDLPGLAQGLLLRSPNGHHWLLTIDNHGLMQWVDLDKPEE